MNVNDLLKIVAENEDEKVDKELNSSSADPNILKPKIGDEITVALLPYAKDPKKTFVTYNKYAAESPRTKKWLEIGRCPSDVGSLEDPIKDYQWELFKEADANKDEDGKKRSYALLPKRYELVNVYIVDHNKQKDMIGTVKAFRYTAGINRKTQAPASAIYSKITTALFGDRKNEIGGQAFLMPENIKKMVLFKIKVVEKSKFANYDQSDFLFPKELDLTSAKVKEILKSAFDLEQFVPDVPSVEEMEKILNQHWRGVKSTGGLNLDVDDDDDDDDDIPMGDSSSSESKRSDGDDDDDDDFDFDFDDD